MRYKTITFLMHIAFAMFFSMAIVSCQEKNTPQNPYSNETENNDNNNNGNNGNNNGNNNGGSNYQYYTFNEPCMEWGKSKSYVGQKMTNLGFVKLMEDTDSDYQYVYYNARKEELYTVTIFTKSGSYSYALIVLEANDSNTKEVAGFLKERYNYISNNNNVLLFRTKDGKTDIELFSTYMNNVLCWVVAYSAKS